MTSIEQAEYNRIEVPKDVEYGAVIVSVEADSSADKAGLKKGDIIIKLGEYKIEDYTYLKYYLYRHKVGEKVDVVYLRDGKEKTVTIKLES